MQCLAPSLQILRPKYMHVFMIYVCISMLSWMPKTELQLMSRDLQAVVVKGS